MSAPSRASEEDSKAAAQKQRVATCLNAATFLAVVTHIINVQSEMSLLKAACHGNIGKVARLTSKCNAVMGMLGLLVNQMGGCASDATNRKAWFLIGPVMSVFLGVLVSKNPRSVSCIVLAKVLKGVFTTFSGTVMLGAVVRDTFAGTEAAMVSAKMAACIGLGIVASPIIESFMLTRTKAREVATYRALAAIGVTSGAVIQLCLPETLAPDQRKPLSLGRLLAAANPFGFVNIFTRGTSALKKHVVITTLHTVIDGKAISDVGVIWLKEHLLLSVEGIRNLAICFGVASCACSAKLTPYLLRTLSTSSYTSLTNGLNFVGFSLRGLIPDWRWLAGIYPMLLPGFNAAPSAALNVLVTQHLVACGFGNAESGAWLGNLRVLVGIFASMAYGYLYSFLRGRGVNPGLTYSFMALIGAGLPQLLFMTCVTAEDLEPVVPPKLEGEKGA